MRHLRGVVVDPDHGMEQRHDGTPVLVYRWGAGPASSENRPWLLSLRLRLVPELRGCRLDFSSDLLG